jgi:hypothetical protein
MDDLCEIFLCDACGEDWWVPGGSPTKACSCGGVLVAAFSTNKQRTRTMASEDPWADVPSGDYMKFDTVGARIAGTVVRIGLGTDFNGNPCPQIVLDTDDGEKTVNCGQANLKAQVMLLDPRPKPGDKMRITYSSTTKAAKGDLKVFTIEHKVSEPVAADDIFGS